MAGLKAGDKIMQVGSEMWCRSTRWQHAYTTVRRTLCVGGDKLVLEKMATGFSNKRVFVSFSQVNGWDMTMVTHDQARKKLTKKVEDVVRLLVTRKSLEDAVKNSMGNYCKQ